MPSFNFDAQGVELVRDTAQNVPHPVARIGTTRHHARKVIFVSDEDAKSPTLNTMKHLTLILAAALLCACETTKPRHKEQLDPIDQQNFGPCFTHPDKVVYRYFSADSGSGHKVMQGNIEGQQTDDGWLMDTYGDCREKRKGEK